MDLKECHNYYGWNRIADRIGKRQFPDVPLRLRNSDRHLNCPDLLIVGIGQKSRPMVWLGSDASGYAIVAMPLQYGYDTVHFIHLSHVVARAKTPRPDTRLFIKKVRAPRLYWFIEWGEADKHYLKTYRTTRKCSGQKPTLNTTQNKAEAIHFDTRETAEAMAQKINTYCEPRDRCTVVHR